MGVEVTAPPLLAFHPITEHPHDGRELGWCSCQPGVPWGQFWLSPALPSRVAGSLIPEKGHASLLSCPISAPSWLSASPPHCLHPRSKENCRRAPGQPGLLETWVRRQEISNYGHLAGTQKAGPKKERRKGGPEGWSVAPQ